MSNTHDRCSPDLCARDVCQEFRNAARDDCDRAVKVLGHAGITDVTVLMGFYTGGRKDCVKARERVATRQGARAVNPLFFPSSDLCAAKKCRILTHRQPGRFDVTTQRATRLELAAFSRENIALHRPSHLHRFRPDLTAYARVLTDRKRSGGIDCALHLAVDEQLVQEFDGAFDRNSSRKRSAGLRWHERAIG